MYKFVYVCMAAAQNIGLVTGLGGLVATRFATEWGALATNPPCDKPVEDCSTLHRGPQQEFVTEGLRQRFVTEGRGTATNHYFGPHPHIYICIYIHICTHIHMYVYLSLYIYAHI